MINDVQIIDLIVKMDDRGYLTEIARAVGGNEQHCIIHQFGQVYLVGDMTKGSIRAYHKHNELWDWFFICHGSAKFVLKDDRKDSSTFEEMMTIVTGTLIGVQIFVAQHFGRREYHRCGEVYWQGIYLALLAAIPAAVLGIWGAGLVRLFRVDPELESFAYTYFRIRMVGGFFIFLTFASEGLLRGVGDTKTPMKVAVFVSALNVVLDYGLIFGKLGLPRMEVASMTLVGRLSAALSGPILPATAIKSI